MSALGMDGWMDGYAGGDGRIFSIRNSLFPPDFLPFGEVRY